MAGTVLAEAPEIAASNGRRIEVGGSRKPRTLTKMCRESMDNLDLHKDPDFDTKRQQDRPDDDRARNRGGER